MKKLVVIMAILLGCAAVVVSGIYCYAFFSEETVSAALTRSTQIIDLLFFACLAVRMLQIPKIKGKDYQDCCTVGFLFFVGIGLGIFSLLHFDFVNFSHSSWWEIGTLVGFALALFMVAWISLAVVSAILREYILKSQTPETKA